MEKDKKKEIKGIAIFIRILKDGRGDTTFQCEEASLLEISRAIAQVELVKGLLMTELKKVQPMRRKEGK